MTGNGHLGQMSEMEIDEIKLAALKRQYTETTDLTWLWSLLFGPVYFWVHGFWVIGFLLLMVVIGTSWIGVLAAPFLAQYCWNKRATEKAEMTLAVSKYGR